MQSDTELIKIGLGFLDTDKYPKAIEYFTQAIELNPASSEAFEFRGIAHFRMFQIEEALADTSKAVELDNENHSAWYNKGEILRYKHKYKEAEQCYQEANRIYSGSYSYLGGLILVTLKQKKCDEAIGFCNQILEDKPADLFALSNRGLAYSKKANYQAAIKDYLKLISCGKYSSTIYNNLGYWYSKTGELKKAYNNLTLALQLNSTHPYALDNLGFVKYLEGDYEKALALINQSLEIDPSNSYGYKNRALVFLKTGRRELAIDDLRKARSLGYADDHGDEVDKLLQAE